MLEYYKKNKYYYKKYKNGKIIRISEKEYNNKIFKQEGGEEGKENEILLNTYTIYPGKVEDKQNVINVNSVCTQFSYIGKNIIVVGGNKNNQYLLEISNIIFNDFAEIEKIDKFKIEYKNINFLINNEIKNIKKVIFSENYEILYIVGDEKIFKCKYSFYTNTKNNKEKIILECLNNFTSYNGDVKCISIYDIHDLVIASSDNCIKKYNTQTNLRTQIVLQKTHNEKETQQKLDNIQDIFIDNSGTYIIAADIHKKIILWKKNDKKDDKKDDEFIKYCTYQLNHEIFTKEKFGDISCVCINNSIKNKPRIYVGIKQSNVSYDDLTEIYLSIPNEPSETIINIDNIQNRNNIFKSKNINNHNNNTRYDGFHYINQNKINSFRYGIHDNKDQYIETSDEEISHKRNDIYDKCTLSKEHKDDFIKYKEKILEMSCRYIFEKHKNKKNNTSLENYINKIKGKIVNKMKTLYNEIFSTHAIVNNVSCRAYKESIDINLFYKFKDINLERISFIEEDSKKNNRIPLNNEETQRIFKNLLQNFSRERSKSLNLTIKYNSNTK